MLGNSVGHRVEYEIQADRFAFVEQRPFAVTNLVSANEGHGTTADGLPLAAKLTHADRMITGVTAAGSCPALPQYCSLDFVAPQKQAAFVRTNSARLGFLSVSADCVSIF
jgi:hypothetical protein